MTTNKDYSSLGYHKSDGYSGCLTRYYDNYAIVVYEDMTIDGIRYGFDVYDESDDFAMNYGRWEYRLFGIWSLDATIAIADMWVAENL